MSEQATNLIISGLIGVIIFLLGTWLGETTTQREVEKRANYIYLLDEDKSIECKNEIEFIIFGESQL